MKVIQKNPVYGIKKQQLEAIGKLKLLSEQITKKKEEYEDSKKVESREEKDVNPLLIEEDEDEDSNKSDSVEHTMREQEEGISQLNKKT